MENTEQSLEKTDDNYKVPNLEKGIAVIEYLSSRSEGETLQAIKVALDISQTTAYRILNTLVRLDYLSFDEDTKRYKLTRKLLTLGFRSLNEHNLLETVLPHLRDLRDRVKETACFGVLGDEKGIFIEQARGDHASFPFLATCSILSLPSSFMLTAACSKLIKEEAILACTCSPLCVRKPIIAPAWSVVCSVTFS